MFRLLLLCLVLVWSTALTAQSTTTVHFTYTVAGATSQQVQAWTPTLYVNNVPFVGTNLTCTGSAPVACSFPAPDFSKALTATGDQRFELTLRSGILNTESARSAPFTEARPGAPSQLQLRSP